MSEDDFEQELFDTIHESIEDLKNDTFYQDIKRRMGPQYFHRDGKPIESDELMPDFLKWAMLFETENRHVAVDTTIYGERLSTVFLGMDHSFNFIPGHKPIIFETMLFAPRSEDLRNLTRNNLTRLGEMLSKGMKLEDAPPPEKSDEGESLKKRFPHDQLQLRYSTEREAADKHEELKLQCLIPPRWRHFLLYTIGGDETWKFWNDDEDETWD